MSQLVLEHLSWIASGSLHAQIVVDSAFEWSLSGTIGRLYHVVLSESVGSIYVQSPQVVVSWRIDPILARWNESRVVRGLGLHRQARVHQV